MDNSLKSLKLIGLGIAIGAVAVVLLLALGARVIEVSVGPFKFGLPTPTVVGGTTLTPANAANAGIQQPVALAASGGQEATGLPSLRGIQSSGPAPSCAGEPVNPQDGKSVNLAQSSWYVVEDYDNSLTPAIHRFVVMQGPRSVTANIIRGQRAWACTDEVAARISAERSAESYKNEHPKYQIFGPDGQEVR